MPRFEIEKYNPAKDSSLEYLAEAMLEGKVVLAVPEGGCPCGCGEKPKSRGRTFAMGHDARYRGKLIRAHLTGTPVRVVGYDGTGEVAARELAAEHGWEIYLLEAEARRAQANERVARRARAHKEKEQNGLVGKKRLVRVGRWEYTGQVVAVYDDGKQVEVQYVTRLGETKRVRVPQEKLQETEEA